MQGIKLDSLNRWIAKLDLSKALEKDITRLQIDYLKRIIIDYDEDTFCSKFYANMNQDFFDKYIKYDSHSIKLANYYECFIKFSNSKTKKKIMKGFDYLDIGQINIYKDNEHYASIGPKSDLLWTAFYDSFIYTEYSKNEFLSLENIEHIYPNHDEILSLKLYDIEHKTASEIYDIVNTILIEVSINYDMEFEIYTPEVELQCEGDCPIIKHQYEDKNYDSIPMMYFKAGLNSIDCRLSFLSFYQVLEYYFTAAKDNALSNGIVKNEDKINERKNLKLEIKELISIKRFKEWINKNESYKELYINENSNNFIDLSNKNSAIEKIVDMIYNCRCSIAHAKNEPNRIIALPTLSDDMIKQLIPIAKFFALEALEHYC